MNEPELESLQSELARKLTEVDAAEHSPLPEWLDPAELSRSRETLVRKRISQTRGLLPMTAKALGPEFAKEFRAFAATHHCNSLDAIEAEAAQFARWLLANCQDAGEDEASRIELRYWSRRKP